MVFPYVSMNSGVEGRKGTVMIAPTAPTLLGCIIMKLGGCVETHHSDTYISSRTVHDRHEILEGTVQICRSAKPIERLNA
jgi:hypothetical protein